MNNKDTVVNWTTIMSALLGLVGGALSGGVAAYTQLKASQEQFSIERAQMFQSLIGQLQEEKTARMALLNLWQLYPDERDQKIIVAAAIETGHPDLVEAIFGFEEEILQLAGILEAKAQSGKESLKEISLQTLIRVDPVRAARVMVDSIQHDIRLRGDRFVTSNTMHDLTLLAQKNEKVVEIIRSKMKEFPEPPLLFDYLLYSAKSDSSFVERVESAYVEQKELTLFNQFLGLANFEVEDSPKIVASARKYVVDALLDSESNEYDLEGALIGLTNNSLARQLEYKDNEINQDFAKSLRDAVANPKIPNKVRKFAFELLRSISRHQALLALAQALSAGSFLSTENIGAHLVGLIASVERENQSFKRPPHCAVVSTNCVSDSMQWSKWLEGMPTQ